MCIVVDIIDCRDCNAMSHCPRCGSTAYFDGECVYCEEGGDPVFVSFDEAGFTMLFNNKIGD